MFQTVWFASQSRKASIVTRRRPPIFDVLSAPALIAAYKNVRPTPVILAASDGEYAKRAPKPCELFGRVPSYFRAMLFSLGVRGSLRDNARRLTADAVKFFGI